MIVIVCWKVFENHEPVKSPETADVIAFNTCHIREKATKKFIQN